MPGNVLISTAYLPPAEYFSVIHSAVDVFIEASENYLKQSYRNRCYILSPKGPLVLSVPVYEGSRHKIPIREARIDYSKRWQQVHLRGITSCYRCTPYFEFFYEPIERIILQKHEFLWDLNMQLFKQILKFLKIKKAIQLTSAFENPVGNAYDFRYKIEPGKNLFIHDPYIQVFGSITGFTPNLSIIDLIFNLGPDTVDYVTRSIRK
jgi:hypothetical protein